MPSKYDERVTKWSDEKRNGIMAAILRKDPDMMRRIALACLRKPKNDEFYKKAIVSMQEGQKSLASSSSPPLPAELTGRNYQHILYPALKVGMFVAFRNFKGAREVHYGYITYTGPGVRRFTITEAPNGHWHFNREYEDMWQCCDPAENREFINTFAKTYPQVGRDYVNGVFKDK
jgi:hypothetical protein